MSHLIRFIRPSSVNKVLLNANKLNSVCVTRLFCEKLENVPSDGNKVSGFAQAFEKHSSALLEEPPKEEAKTFASLLRNSKFVDVNRKMCMVG